MGSATSLVGGDTINSAFGFGRGGKVLQQPDEKNCKLCVTYSPMSTSSSLMRSRELLHSINTRLGQMFPGLDVPFKHIVVFGDFHQCTPVMQHPLWKSVRSTSKSATEQAAGCAIWHHNFTNVIQLEEIMRQRDEKDWAELLCRHRNGTPTIEDMRFINTRGDGVIDASEPLWRNATILTATNDVRRELSRLCAIRDAQDHGDTCSPMNRSLCQKGCAISRPDGCC